MVSGLPSQGLILLQDFRYGSSSSCDFKSGDGGSGFPNLLALEARFLGPVK